MLTIHTELARIQDINKRLLAGLKKLSIITVKDLLMHLPFRYDDFSLIVNIGDLVPDQTVTIRGHIKKISARRAWRRNIILIEAIIADDTGSIRAVWFNQPYLLQTLPVGTVGNFAGKISLSKSNEKPYLSNPVYEPVGNETKHTSGLVAIYPETKGLTSRGIRYLMKPILDNLTPIPECIPRPLLKELRLPDMTAALRTIHFPRSIASVALARRRIAFEDLFLLHLMNARAKMALARETAPAIHWTPAERDMILASLPFSLTPSQKQSLEEILMDIAQSHPMNRLLQGDVGSGKTVIVATAAILAARQGNHAAILAPTEVLARQHYHTFIKLFGAIMNQWHINVCLLISAEGRSFHGDGLETILPKKRLLTYIKEGHMHITIGTHALLQKNVSFPALGIIIVDEQHRFGVEQRATLTKKNTDSELTIHDSRIIPHFLSMSATPIPRTLSLTLFGDLDLSIINELPRGRRAIITKIVAPANRVKAYRFIREQARHGRQIFVICPRIEATNNDNALSLPQSLPFNAKRWDDVKTVIEEYEKLSSKIFPDLTVAMLHGKLKNSEKARIMRDFTENKIHILVATSVIEVGIDVPNATIMMIEDADRFGLAQLYQFRGRVGRGTHQSVCLLFTKSASSTVRERLTSLVEAKNGFELAEKDLAMRGPGEFLGKSQTGIPDLAMKALNNIELVKAARHAAVSVLASDPDLQNVPLLKERLLQFNKTVHLE